MAEFQEVMKQAKRMCKASGDTCLSCPVDGGGTCAFIKSPWSLTEEKIAETEKIVIDWAAKHPEARYPSWSETWRRLFPDARYTPCPESEFGIKMECNGGCKACRDKPIPADVAEKLGIKPIGGDADA